MKLILNCLAFAVIAYGHPVEKNKATSDPLVIPCSKNDIPCLTKSAQKFLKASAAGIPLLNVLPIDPMRMKRINVTLDSGDKVVLKNIVVKGLQNLIIQDFKIDTVKKSVMLAMEADPKIEADMKVGKKKVGKIATQGKVGPIANYTYDLVPNKAGVEYFTVGPDTIFCDMLGVQKGSTTQKAYDVLIKDNFDDIDAILKQLLCSVLDPAFHTIIHNLREIAKIYPKTDFFTDL